MSSWVTRMNVTKVATFRDTPAMARDLVQGWMGSQGHRENILDKEARRIGVGVAIEEKRENGYITETVYATLNFSACR